MAVKAPSAAWAWLFWLLLGCGWVIMLAGVSALQQVCGGWLESCHCMPAGPRQTVGPGQTTLFMLSSCFLANRHAARRLRESAGSTVINAAPAIT